MSDFLIGSGLRLASVVSYNHLGNNDGKNLSEDKCFQSKKISKGGVLDDAIKGNSILKFMLKCFVTAFSFFLCNLCLCSNCFKNNKHLICQSFKAVWKM